MGRGNKMIPLHGEPVPRSFSEAGGQGWVNERIEYQLDGYSCNHRKIQREV
jgi:hypothetical protein